MQQQDPIRIEAPDGAFDAYLSRPAHPNGHAVIVLQEIFGVTAAVRGITDRFAEDGYLALAPDLYWRLERGVQLSHSREDMAHAFSLLERYRDADGLADIDATARHIRALPGFCGKVAVAGMCLGGKLSYLAAAHTRVDAAVAFYGVGIEKHLADAAQLHTPLMMHFGDRDRYVPEEARAQIARAVAGQDVALHVYPGADHGFYTRGTEQDIALARARTNTFLAEKLG